MSGIKQYLSQSQTLSLSRIFSLNHTFSLSITHSLFFSHFLSQSHILSLNHTFSLSITHTLSLSHIFSLSLSRISQSLEVFFVYIVNLSFKSNVCHINSVFLSLFLCYFSALCCVIVCLS